MFLKIVCSKIILLFSVVCYPGHSQTSIDFANSLMDDGDYFRAISEYKRTAFFISDSSVKDYCYWQISKAYYKSSKYLSSINTLNLLLKRPKAFEEYKYKGNLLLGLNHFKLNNYAASENSFGISYLHDTTGTSLYYLALLDVQNRQWERAYTRYDTIIEKQPNEILAHNAKVLKDDIKFLKHIPKKNAFLAATLSSIIPGTGQAYSRHYYDGLQAFVFVAAFAYASYISYRYDHKYNDNYVMTGVSVSITSLFHVANVIGAYKTAQYFNIKNNNSYMNAFRQKALQVEP